MALDASTLEWIRRLPAVPEPPDVATLRALRRNASAPGDVRLLDSLLAPAMERDRAQQERQTLESRLAYLESQADREARARTAEQRELAVKQLARALMRGALVGVRPRSVEREPPSESRTSERDENERAGVADDQGTPSRVGPDQVTRTQSRGTSEVATPRHPAKFSPAQLSVLGDWFKGTSVCLIRSQAPAAFTSSRTRPSVSIEPEWRQCATARSSRTPSAFRSPTLRLTSGGDVTNLRQPSCGSPNARDCSVRHSYKHDLGRNLHPDNSGAMHTGPGATPLSHPGMD